jgi:molybdenum cofactor cytidylyltransferase
MIVGAVVLAAGKSERMGQNKLLLCLNGKKLIEIVLDALSEAGIDEQVIVIGYKPKEIIEAVQPRLNKVKVAINWDYENGMTSSFQKGLQVLRHVDAAFLVLGDEPIFDSKVLRSMIRQMQKSRGEALIVSPIHKGKKGHPLLFQSQLFTEIFDLKGTETIRDIVHRHTDKLLKIESPQWTVMDIDTPEDYRHVRDLV